jgi:hypothetical protein
MISSRHSRGQTMVLLALSMLLVVLMACITLSLSGHVRRKMELQTVADAAAYNNAVATARGFNSTGLINRTIVSHWVVMLGIEANVAWGSTVPAYFDSFADTLNEMRWSGQCSNAASERLRQKELLAARDAFNHASLSLWSGSGASGDPIGIPGCPGCAPRLSPGLGQLDRDAANQAKEVWRSVRDLVDVQRDLNDELKLALKDQNLARQAALAALGKPMNQPDPYPYKVRRGAPQYEPSGLPGRPPGWREVSEAIGTDREAMLPLAHAAMGSRGSRFVTSNKYQVSATVFKTFTPRRAKVYAQRIEKAMNRLFPNQKFNFHVHGQESTTFLDDGKHRDDDPGADADDVYSYVPAADNLADSDEEGNDPPEVYKPDIARRITPSRDIGMEEATAFENGSIHIMYVSPCGVRDRQKAITAMGRAHTDMSTPPVSGHEWRQTKREARGGDDGAPDGTKNYQDSGNEWLHGVVSAKHGWDRSGHRPGGLCHPSHRHWGEANDTIHVLGKEIDGLGLSPGGFGFVFPQNVNPGKPRHDGAVGAFGQPKLPVLLTRANHGPGIPVDPWNLTFRFSFARTGPGELFDLAKLGDPTPQTVLATGMAYYHRRCDRYRAVPQQDPDGSANACTSWQEAPNLLNPFWRA